MPTQELEQPLPQPRALDGPVLAAGQVGHRLQHVQHAVPGRRHRRGVQGRDGDQPGGVAHQLLALDQLLERRTPAVSEVDVVVRGPRWRPAPDAQVPDHRRGGVAACADGPGRTKVRQQGAVGGGQVDGEHHRVGGQPLPAGPDAGHPALAIGEDAVDWGAVAQVRAGVRQRRGQCAGHRMHALLREPDPADRVHVGDHRVQRERVVGRQPGVHRLEGEQPDQPVVGEPAAHGRPEASEATQPDQPGGGGRIGQQVERSVEVPGDEVRQLDVVQRRQPVDEAGEGGGVRG